MAPGVLCALQAAIVALPLKSHGSYVSVFLPGIVIKSLDQKQLREEGLILANGSVVESIVGKAWWLERDAAAHAAPTVGQ